MSFAVAIAAQGEMLAGTESDIRPASSGGTAKAIDTASGVSRRTSATFSCVECDGHRQPQMHLK